MKNVKQPSRSVRLVQWELSPRSRQKMQVLQVSVFIGLTPARLYTHYTIVYDDSTQYIG
jgi:hypothetical protein